MLVRLFVRREKACLNCVQINLCKEEILISKFQIKDWHIPSGWRVGKLLSNFHENKTFTVSQRMKDETKAEITVQSIVKDYNAFMGVVDK